jgi:hypothetical protein
MSTSALREDEVELMKCYKRAVVGTLSNTWMSFEELKESDIRATLGPTSGFGKNGFLLPSSLLKKTLDLLVVESAVEKRLFRAIPQFRLPQQLAITNAEDARCIINSSESKSTCSNLKRKFTEVPTHHDGEDVEDPLKLKMGTGTEDLLSPVSNFDSQALTTSEAPTLHDGEDVEDPLMLKMGTGTEDLLSPVSNFDSQALTTSAVSIPHVKDWRNDEKDDSDEREFMRMVEENNIAVFRSVGHNGSRNDAGGANIRHDTPQTDFADGSTNNMLHENDMEGPTASNGNDVGVVDSSTVSKGALSARTGTLADLGFFVSRSVKSTDIPRPPINLIKPLTARTSFRVIPKIITKVAIPPSTAPLVERLEAAQASIANMSTDKSRDRNVREKESQSDTVDRVPDRETQSDVQSLSLRTTTTHKKVHNAFLSPAFQNRIDMLKAYDARELTTHSQHVSITKEGLQCLLCKNKPMYDPGHFFRYEKDGVTGCKDTHVFSGKHQQCMKENLLQKLKQTSMITKLSTVTPTLTDEIKKFRHDLLKVCLVCKWSPYALDKPLVRNFFMQHSKYGASGQTSAVNLLREYLPFFCKGYEDDTNAIIVKKKFVSICVDGTTKVGEWMGFVVRYVDENDPLLIMQRCMLFRFKKSLAERRHFELSNTLLVVAASIFMGSPDINEAFGRIVAFMADRASLNRTTLLGDHIKASFPNAVYLDCHSHTFSNAAKMLETQLESLGRLWELHVNAFKGLNAKNVWTENMDKSMKTYSSTRWFSKRNVLVFVCQRWDEYTEFFNLAQFDDYKADTAIKKLRVVLNPNGDAEQLQRLFLIRLELAIICDCTRRLHEATYHLEGDGPVALLAYDEVQTALRSISVANIDSFPLVVFIIDAKVQAIEDEDEAIAVHNNWSDYVLEKIQYANHYCHTHFVQTVDRPLRVDDNNFGHLQGLFEVFALCNPDFINRKRLVLGGGFNVNLVYYIQQKLTWLSANHTHFTARITPELRIDLLRQVEEYLAVCVDINYQDLHFNQKIDALLEFWRLHRLNHRLSAWWEFAQIGFLYQPASGSVERLFSHLTRVLSSEREGSNDDLIKAGVYQAYDEALRKKRANVVIN